MNFKDLRKNLEEAAVPNLQRIRSLAKGTNADGENHAVKMAALQAAILQLQKVGGDINKLQARHRKAYVDYAGPIANAAVSSPTAMSIIMRNLQKEEIYLEAVNIPHDPPMMLVLKRNGIRIFPDGKKVALYTNNQLGLTFSVPYVGGQQLEPTVSTGMGMSEEVDMLEENIKRLRFASAKNGKPVSINFKTGDSMKVDPITAKAITRLHTNLSSENKITLMDKISNDPESFKKVASFAHKNYTYKEK